MKEFEKQLEENAKQLKQGIRESKYGLLKLIGLEIIPVVMGAGLGGIGRATGEEYIPAIPVVIDLMWGITNPLTLIKYSFGVSLAYADIFYPFVITALIK